jgi:ribose transport system permease protein
MTKKNSALGKLGQQKYIVILVLVALYLFFFILSPNFRKYTTLVTLLDFSYYYVLMAIGVAFPLITGGVDLSIGTGMICYALTGGYLVRYMHLPVWVGLVVAIIFGIGVGFLNGILVAVMDLPAFLATLCTCMITRGLGSLCAHSFAIPWPTQAQAGGWFHNIFKITLADNTKIPIGFLWMVILVIVMSIILNHTRIGRYAIAIGSNKEATALSGINVRFYHIMAYVICGLFAGMAAIPYASAIPTVQPGTGAGMELNAIGGAIVGGVAATGGSGSITGTFFGVYVICLLQIGLPFIGLQSNWTPIITGLILIGTIMIDIIKKRREVVAMENAAK